MQGEYLKLFPSTENLHYTSFSHLSEKNPQNHRTFLELCQACSEVHLIVWGTLQ